MQLPTAITAPAFAATSCGRFAQRAVLLVTVWLASSCVTHAAPTLTVSNLGPNLSGNLEWLVEVTPDPTLFTATDLGLGSSLAVELAFEVIDSDLLGVSVNGADWPIDIAAINPFTLSDSTGVVTDFADDTLFVSLLSDFFTAGTPVEVMTLETSGEDCTTLLWGGHTILEGTVDEYESSLIAQAGQNYTAYSGSLTEPELDGDFDADCDVDGADFLEWQRHFGSPYTAGDLTDWVTNYGTKAPLQAISTPVPEPSTLCLLLLCSVAIFRHDRLNS